MRNNEEHIDPILDDYFWMTRDLDVELRAFGIPNVESRELFCRSMGGHWSTEHGKFFRIPGKECKKEGASDRFVEVERDPKISEQLWEYGLSIRIGLSRIRNSISTIFYFFRYP